MWQARMQNGEEKPFPFHSNLSAEQFYSKARRKPQTQLNEIANFNDKINTQSNTRTKQLNSMMEVNSLLNQQKISFKTIKKQFSIIFTLIHVLFSFIGKFYLFDAIILFLILQTIIVSMNILHYYQFPQSQHRIKLIYAHLIILMISIIGIIHIPQTIVDGLTGGIVILADILMMRELVKILNFLKRVLEEKKSQKEQIDDEFDDL